MLDFTQCDWIDLTKLTRYHQNLMSFLSENYLNKSGGTMNGQINSCSILPKSPSSYNLGSSTNQWSNIYSNGFVLVDSTGQIRPNSTGTGNIGTSSYYWGNAYINNITSGTIVPKTDNIYDLGSSTYKWKDAYINNIHGTVDDVKETALSIPTGAILRLSAKGCTTASIAQDNGVIDISGNGHHTKAYGDITVGYDEGGAYFDTNTNGYIAYNNNFNYLSDKFSVRIRFKHIAISSEGYIFSLNRNDGTAGQKFSIEYFNNGGFQWALDGAYSTYWLSFDTTKIYDIVLTRDTNNKGKLYINGVWVASINVSNILSRSNLTIGCRSNSPSGAATSNVYHWQGRIYAFQVFDYDLSETQVKSLYMFPDEALFAQLTADLIGTNVVNAKNLVKTEAVITEAAQISQAIVKDLVVTNGVTIGDLNTTAQNANTTATSANTKIDNLQVGGRNLLLDSNNGGNGFSGTYGMNHVIARLNYGSIKPKQGDKITFSAKLSQVDWDFTNVIVFFSSGNNPYVLISSEYLTKDNIYVRSVVLSGDVTETLLYIQANVKSGVSGTTTTKIDWVKLEFGNKVTTWTPAPEDVDADISTAQSTANTAVSNAATAQSGVNTLNEIVMPNGEIFSLTADNFNTDTTILDDDIGFQNSLQNAYASNPVTLKLDKEQGCYIEFVQNETNSKFQSMYELLNRHQNAYFITDVTDLNANGYTIWTRVRLRDLTVHTDGGDIYAGIFCLGNYGNHGISLRSNNAIYASINFPSVSADTVGSGFSDYVNKWIDICFTADSVNAETRKIKLYLNGVLKENKTTTTQITSGQASSVIARGGGSHNSGFANMDFKAAKVWNRPLTAGEVAGLTKYFNTTGSAIAKNINTAQTTANTANTTANTAVTNLNNINLISDSTIHAMFDDLPTFKRYGFIVTQNDVLTDATGMVEYIYDAVGMTPAGLNSSNEFNYGSWETFCNEICKPAMVAPDGSIMYELDHTDQTKKLDGTASAYDNSSQSGNMMSVFKRMYISITEPDSTHLKVVISDAKLDETYQAYAFTDENGRKKDVAFFSMFNGIKDSNNKLRSLKSSSQAIYSTSGVTMRTYAKNNGSMWDFPDYSLWNYIQCLLVLISKSLDVKTKFGKGNISGGQSNPSLPGALISTGMFSGTTANETSPVKTFYIENMWGNSWNWVNGLLSYNGNYYLKLTPPYTNSSTSGYSNVGEKPASGSYGAIKTMGNYDGVMLPKTTSGTDYSKWYKSRFYNGYGTSDANVRTALVGGDRANGSICSVFSIALYGQLSTSDWHLSARLAGR